MARPSARPRLLAEAVELVTRSGPAALTYEALASATGTSKGGLLYHFPTKGDLVGDLLDAVLDGFEAEVARRRSEGASFARAYVDATFDLDASQPDVALVLLQASPEVDEPLLARCRARFDRWHELLLDDGLDPGTAAVIRYACDGWWTMRVLGAETAEADATVLRDRLLAALDAPRPVRGDAAREVIS